MSVYLLDTCTISDLFSGSTVTKQRLRSLPPSQIAMSAVTVMEILYGFELNPAVKQKYSEPFRNLRSITQTLLFDNALAEIAARLRSDLRRKGTPIGCDLDLMFGSTGRERIQIRSNTCTMLDQYHVRAARTLPCFL